ncbi:hypothetical protein AUJ84_02645 [Candidatus Pacearchaeota archaeon CG1_02_32_132]|nr:MAG: hypothetical protein AUJ84_02645 [Candidatus Pacearchaeota archaeon CG1_02_32_132]
MRKRDNYVLILSWFIGLLVLIIAVSGVVSYKLGSSTNSELSPSISNRDLVFVRECLGENTLSGSQKCSSLSCQQIELALIISNFLIEETCGERVARESCESYKQCIKQNFLDINSCSELKDKVCLAEDYRDSKIKGECAEKISNYNYSVKIYNDRKDCPGSFSFYSPSKCQINGIDVC